MSEANFAMSWNVNFFVIGKVLFFRAWQKISSQAKESLPNPSTPMFGFVVAGTLRTANCLACQPKETRSNNWFLNHRRPPGPSEPLFSLHALRVTPELRTPSLHRLCQASSSASCGSEGFESRSRSTYQGEKKSFLPLFPLPCRVLSPSANILFCLSLEKHV